MVRQYVIRHAVMLVLEAMLRSAVPVAVGWLCHVVRPRQGRKPMLFHSEGPSLQPTDIEQFGTSLTDALASNL